jgi:hypothetical protein
MHNCCHFIGHSITGMMMQQRRQAQKDGAKDPVLVQKVSIHSQEKDVLPGRSPIEGKMHQISGGLKHLLYKGNGMLIFLFEQTGYGFSIR